MKQILVVDDDTAFSRAVCLSLSDLATTRAASSATEALDYLNREPFAIVVTDYKLATGSTGLELASTIRRFKSPPSIIMMTAFATTKLAIDSVNMGLFAFVEKPFDADELRSHVQRALSPDRESQQFELDPSKNCVAYNGENYVLTKTEYAIIALFISHPNQWLTRTAIEDAIWSETRSGSPNIFDTHLTNLRRKLPFLKDRLEAVRGRGYVFKDS